MPLMELTCPDCQFRFERVVYEDEEPVSACPKCGGCEARLAVSCICLQEEKRMQTGAAGASSILP